MACFQSLPFLVQHHAAARPRPRTYNVIIASELWRELGTIVVPIPDEPCAVAELLGQIQLRARPFAVDVGALYLELPPMAQVDTAPVRARFHPLDECHQVISEDDRLIAAPARRPPRD